MSYDDFTHIGNFISTAKTDKLTKHRAKQKSEQDPNDKSPRERLTLNRSCCSTLARQSAVGQ